MNEASSDSRLRTSTFEYDLPPDLIAQTPLAVRHESRLLVLPITGGDASHHRVRDLPHLLRPGDLIVANNSRVLPARLHAVKSESGGNVEFLLLQRGDDDIWNALAKPSRRLRSGMALGVLERANPESNAAAPARIESVEGDGSVRLWLSPEIESDLSRFGQMPLPPYIHDVLPDQERYQTIYAAETGSAAAPTAGLHVSPHLLEQLGLAGIGWAEVTLHVGLDTFRPITTTFVDEHRIHHEWCAVSDATAAKIADCRMNGGRVIALGTTSARTLETFGAVFQDDRPCGWCGSTGLFIVPGYRWTLVDGLITNFHLPHSSLLAMVSALVGWGRLRSAYELAVAERYRFFSFGDAMLIV